MPTSPLILLLATLQLQTSDSPRTFDRVVLVETKGETSASVSLGDIDGDGDLDLILAKGRHWPLHDFVLRNDGKGNFQAEAFSESPDRTYSAALADLDGDGDLDIAVSNDKPDRKLIYLNDGKGRFQLSGTFGDASWNTRYITLADLNGDKRPDIVVANRSSRPDSPASSFFCINQGKGSFPECKPLPTQSATIIVAADFDNDGAIDLLVPHRDGGQSVIFWNGGAADFGPAMAVGPRQSSVRAAAAGDLDGDGLRDIVVGDEKTGLFLARNQGKRSFSNFMPLGTEAREPYAIAVADLNHDNKLDLVVGNNRKPGSVFFNTGALQFREIPWGDGVGAVYGVAIGDLDGDGWPDIAAARSDAPNGVWFSRSTRLK